MILCRETCYKRAAAQILIWGSDPLLCERHVKWMHWCLSPDTLENSHLSGDRHQNNIKETLNSRNCSRLVLCFRFAYSRSQKSTES